MYDLNLSYRIVSHLFPSYHKLASLILPYTISGAGSATEATEEGMVETERHTRLRPYEILLRKFNYQQVPCIVGHHISSLHIAWLLILSRLISSYLAQCDLVSYLTLCYVVLCCGVVLHSIICLTRYHIGCYRTVSISCTALPIAPPLIRPL